MADFLSPEKDLKGNINPETKKGNGFNPKKFHQPEEYKGKSKKTVKKVETAKPVQKAPTAKIKGRKKGLSASDLRKSDFIGFYNKKVRQRNLIILLFSVIIIIGGLYYYFIVYRPSQVIQIPVVVVTPQESGPSEESLNLPPTPLAPLRGALIRFSDSTTIYLVEENGDLRRIDSTTVVFDNGLSLDQVSPNLIYLLPDKWKTIRRDRDVIGQVDFDPRYLNYNELLPFLR